MRTYKKKIMMYNKNEMIESVADSNTSSYYYNNTETNQVHPLVVDFFRKISII